MKICLMNNLYKPFNRGGAEKITEIIANGLVKAGHEVFIIATKPLRGKFKISDTECKIYYLNSLYRDLNKFPKFFRLFWQIWNMFDFINYFKIKNILQKEKCEAVISNNLMGLGLLAPLAVKKLNIKHSHIVHDIQLVHPSGAMYYGKEGMIDNFFSKIYGWICRWLIASPRTVIFPSRWIRDLHIKKKFFSRSEIIVLPNPVVSAPKQACPPNRRADSENCFNFLFLGQIEKHKGVFLLMQAFNKIKNKYPEIELIFAGDGSQIENARKLAANNKNIKFLGWPGDEQADKLLFSSHCLVYPSLVYENCPNAIQRALSAGIHVLAADIGGIPELLNKNSGALFKPSDVDDLAEKMTRAVENKIKNSETPDFNVNIKDYIKKIIAVFSRI